MKDAPISVLLPDAHAADKAREELHHAPLFNKRINVVKRKSRSLYLSNRGFRDLSNGWYASSDPSPKYAKPRGVLMRYPQNIFAPLREQRSIGFSNIAFDSDVEPALAMEQVVRDMYQLLHNFKVLSVGWPSQRLEYLSDGKTTIPVIFSMVSC